MSATSHEGTFLVEGKSTYTFVLPDGRQVKGSDLQQASDWPWRDSRRCLGCAMYGCGRPAQRMAP